MTDSTLNRFVSSGSHAARLAFTAVPPTPASGPSPCYIWYETDTGSTFTQNGNGTWTQMNVAGTAATTTDVLTGTDATKYVSSDALAALWEQGGNLTSGSTVSVGEGGYFHVTGTTTITDIDFSVDKTGRSVVLVFDGILTLTHNATTLILPTGANITTAAGDTCRVVSEGSDNVRVVDYQRKDGTALVAGASGALVLLESHTASNVATLDFTTRNATGQSGATIQSDYDDYLIEIMGVVPVTNAVHLYMNMSTNGGSSYDTGANYGYEVVATNRFGSTQQSADTGGTKLIFNGSAIANTSTAGIYGSLKLKNPSSTSQHKNVGGNTNYLTGSTLEVCQLSGNYQSTTAVNAFQFLFSSGNLSSGPIRVYGVAK